MDEAAWQQLESEIEALRRDIRDLQVVQEVDASELRAHLQQRYSFEDPIDLPIVVRETAEMLRRWNVHVTHPRYFGLFNPSVLEGAVIGDALVAAFNPQLAAWSHAPAAQEIERHVLRHFAALLGFDPDRTAANYTSGGAEANLTAVLAAIAKLEPDTSRGGISALSRPFGIYLTEQSHHSFVKIARMTGLGTDCLREVGMTDGLAMDPASLRERMASDRADGWRPAVVIATAGTTSAGAIDPLEELHDVATDFGAWFHVDAAWGAAAVLSPRLRPLLRGIERADSVTWDAHKWLSVPMGAGMFFCRHPEALRQAFAVSTSYMPGPTGGDTADPYAVTTQWSRRATGLKVFVALAEIGTGGYGELIEHQAHMGDELRSLLDASGWILVNDTRLPLVCFTHPRIRDGGVTTRQILDVIYRRGHVWISDVLLGGESVFRACITSYRTEEEDLAVLVEELDVALNEIAAGSPP